MPETKKIKHHMKTAAFLDLTFVYCIFGAVFKPIRAANNQTKQQEMCLLHYYSFIHSFLSSFQFFTLAAFL